MASWARALCRRKCASPANFCATGDYRGRRTTVERLTSNRAHCNDGRTLEFDGCLWAGAFVVPPLATMAGLPVDTQGRLLVDETLRVIDHPEIYVAGDAAATGLRMACATAMPMGAYVADQLAARLLEQPQPAPFRFAYMIQCISLGRQNGLVQLVHGDDSPKPRIVTGWCGTHQGANLPLYDLELVLGKAMAGALYMVTNPSRAAIASGNCETKDSDPSR
ncbi:MAG: FAD-dependent oxidoreductase [Caldilineaceae bacterium]